VSAAIHEASEREYLLERLRSLRAILPLLAEELAGARRQNAQLQLENGRLLEQMRELNRQRAPQSRADLEHGDRTGPRRTGATDSLLLVR